MNRFMSKWGLVNLLIAVTLAYSPHPFVGEQAEETHIKREDGSIAMRMRQKPAQYNKFHALMNDRISFDKPVSASQMLWESVFGKSLAKLDFEAQVEEFIEWKQRQNFKHKKLGAYIPSLLKTLDASMWAGTVYMGKWQPMDVVFDTGSDWLMIESIDCVNCEGRDNTTGEVYNTTKGAMISDPDSAMSQRFYGHAVLSGYEWEDTVCLLLTECVPSFKYFAIYQQEGVVEPVDGVLGMARNKPFLNSDPDSTNTVGPLFVEAMVNEGIIDENTFSFYMNMAGESSYVDFGTPQESAMKDPDELQYMYPNDDFFWSFTNSMAAFGTVDNAYQYANAFVDGSKQPHKAGLYSIFDSGSSTINVPAQYFEGFLEKIFEQVGPDADYKVVEGFVLTRCYTNFPELFFQISYRRPAIGTSSRWIQVKPEDYVYDSSPNKDESQCTLFISAIDEDMMVLGLPAFQQYYTVHDNQRNRLGFVPHTFSTKTALRSDSPFAKGTISTGRYGGPPVWAAIIVAVVILGGATYFFGWHWLDYCKDWYPDSKWIRVELWTAYWFGVLLLLMLVRFLFNM